MNSAFEVGADRVSILGVPVSGLDRASTVETILRWAGRHESRYICACDAHSIFQFARDEGHREALLKADMITADGRPLVWVARMRGNSQIERVSGPDLMPAVCAASQKQGLRHYFYGGSQGVAMAVALELRKACPVLAIAGSESPPFRPLSSSEEDDLERRLREAEVNIMWIALGCPRQEKWMREHVGKFKGVVLIGVGAAFDFQCKRIPRAPLWMQNAGLEWLHRLCSEPQRLWRRYLLTVPWFAAASLAETVVLFSNRLRTVKPTRAPPWGI